MHDPVYLNTTQPIYTWPNLSINDPTYPSNILSIHSPTHHHATTQHSLTRRNAVNSTTECGCSHSRGKRKRASSVYLPPSSEHTTFTSWSRHLTNGLCPQSMTHHSLYLFFFPPAACEHSRPWYWVLVDVSETKCLHGQSSGVVTLRSPLSAGEVQSVLAPFHGWPEVKMLLQQKQRVSWLVVGEHIQNGYSLSPRMEGGGGGEDTSTRTIHGTRRRAGGGSDNFSQI